jgi:hypothetical protein
MHFFPNVKSKRGVVVQTCRNSGQRQCICILTWVWHFCRTFLIFLKQFKFLTLYWLLPLTQGGGKMIVGMVVKRVTGSIALETLGTVEASVVGKIVGQFSSSSPCGHSSVPSQI